MGEDVVSISLLIQPQSLESLKVLLTQGLVYCISRTGLLFPFPHQGILCLHTAVFLKTGQMSYPIFLCVCTITK